MKRQTILLLTAALGLTMSAQARIGDSVKQSDARHGRAQLRTDGGFESRIYVNSNWNIEAGFNAKGYCVFIDYSHVDGSNLSPAELDGLLARNQVDAKHPYRAYNGSPKYATWADGVEFYAIYADEPQTYADGRSRTVPSLRITNRATLIARGLWIEPAPNQTVDDSI